MDIKKKVLIVYEHSRDVAAIKRRLQADNCDVIMTPSGVQAELIAQSHCPEMILLGVQIEDKDGISVLRSIRTWSSVPVIVVSSSGRERDMLDALDNGADDYISIPCSMAQFMSRIQVAMRHCSPIMGDIVDGNRFRVGDLVIDYNRYRAYVSGKDAELTHNEFKIVALLGKNAGKICTYDYLLSQLWGPNATGDNQILRVNMTNIRRKIESDTSDPQYIKTISGVGYRLVSEHNK